MISIFSCPKPFHGHIKTIQRNALGSWLRLKPACEVFLFGNEEGTADTAKEFGFTHLPDVARNGRGTPLLDDMFNQVDARGLHQTCAFVNSDIILPGNFTDAVARVKDYSGRFLMIGECWNLGVEEPLRFSDPAWPVHLRQALRERGVARGLWGIDYLVFPKRLYQGMPPFTVGRAGFDNWLVWKARALRVPVVDATDVVSAIHQNHDYAHVTGGRQESYYGEEARLNRQLAGGRQHMYTIRDASHRLSRAGIRRNLSGVFRSGYRWHAFQVNVLERTRHVRNRLGLSRAVLSRIPVGLGRRRRPPTE